ncbi:putative quinol monooxygenase [Streptomyces sp. NPDC002619]|uniref:putative quinol monooxygenase n=1 Tax=Streptomyces sp. NPDC002619 TaxID=3364655 RepID=UPI003686A41B
MAEIAEDSMRSASSDAPSVRSARIRSCRTIASFHSPTSPPRPEPGNLFFEWSVDTAAAHRFVLLEAFASSEAGAAHVNSNHFKTAMAWMPDVVAETPDLIHVETEGQGWSRMAEVTPRR